MKRVSSPSLQSDTSRAAALGRVLRDARERTLALASDLAGERLLGPRLSIVNPPLWEIGHLGWFQERWCLRLKPDGTLGPSMFAGADALYDSATVAHSTRWDLPLPHFDATLAYLRAVLDRTCERLSVSCSTDLAYFAELAAAHEEMHCEAFTYTRQTLGHARPRDLAGFADVRGETDDCAGDVEVQGGNFELGAVPADGFVFDNEKWAHRVRVEPFRIARAAVSNGEFAAFVEDAGYARPELWSREGWSWREKAGAGAPVYWRRERGAWIERVFAEWTPLAPGVPVMHVSWYEAEAYCRWAGRRLPTEAEWECAAATSPTPGERRRYPWGAGAPDALRANLYGCASGRIGVSACAAGDSAWGCRQMLGNVWEWTADTFGPYPGFVMDPYKEYSQPWFGDHRVLRGGAYATRGWLMRNTWRNFYTPDRRDVLAGFRTCAA
jgi:iron(II)-dependent oxidoreductase